MTIRTRFAPSPTGYLHMGGVRTALFNWLLARQSGGQFVLRIDDTDVRRNLAQALQPILDGFRWLGLDWDEGPETGGDYGPYFQSQRTERYQQAVAELLARGAAYRDYARPEEIQAEREQAERDKQDFVYSRRWAAADDAQAAEFEAQGREPVVRLMMPRSGSCVFQDAIRGQVEVQWRLEQDHVVQRSDGSFLYHLASVVDDHDMRITHVVRAAEHLSNTPRQIFIAQALGYPLPQFAHLPFVAEPGGSAKMSKRKIAKYLKNPDFKKLQDEAAAIMSRIGDPRDAESFNPLLTEFYQRVGFLPDAVLNYLLLLGWSLDDKTEQFSRQQMVRHFTLERVNKSPASFDPVKLLAFQQRYMNQLPPEQKTQMVLPYLQQAHLVAIEPDRAAVARVELVVRAAGDRIAVAGDILKFEEMFVDDDALQYNEADFERRMIQDSEAGFLLAEFKKLLVCEDDFTPDHLETLVKDFAARQGIKPGRIIHPLRFAITGKSVGMGLYDTMEILGQKSAVRRIERAIEQSLTHDAT